MKRASDVSISSSARRPLGTAYIPILLSEVEQEQRPSGNGDREAIVVGAGLCGNWSLGLMPFGLKSFGLIQLVTWLDFFKAKCRGYWSLGPRWSI